jgi:hypothetical protein
MLRPKRSSSLHTKQSRSRSESTTVDIMSSMTAGAAARACHTTPQQLWVRSHRLRHESTSVAGTTATSCPRCACTHSVSERNAQEAESPLSCVHLVAAEA